LAERKKSQIDSVKANRIYKINEDSIATQKETMDAPKIPEPIFKDISARLHFKHHEDNYDDYKRQPLMPLKLSQLGPGIAWLDYNGDGRPDLFETSGKGGIWRYLRMKDVDNSSSDRFPKL
jgi:hypothetical protein